MVVWRGEDAQLHVGRCVKGIELELESGECPVKVLVHELVFVRDCEWRYPFTFPEPCPVTFVDPSLVLASVPFFQLGYEVFRIVLPAVWLS